MSIGMANTPPTDNEVNAALRVLQRDYQDDVQGIVDEMRRQVRDGECDEDDFFERLDEQIDGHQRVIYTAKARVGLCCTDNPDAYQDETGELAPESVEVAMYYALRADVTAILGDFDDAKNYTEGE